MKRFFFGFSRPTFFITTLLRARTNGATNLASFSMMNF